ncbi:MAG: hypothetical protein A2X12_06025 [Bacteroidetes bacterium GWE2_29_8]|nr:MAG: hypothetical protein A2X12_06025 [Bacteroidetes bacterium GWE2_29_8]OFY20054.1 MAG: hypothetical protein A2X02_06725 [Bacteroidetes bacterium GWF2_29_10]
MIRYTSVKQISIDEFKTPFEMHLNKSNRWVQLSEQIPWDKFVGIYQKVMSSKKGAPGINGRVVIGAIIIKHIMRLYDRGTISLIQENPYMQYFIGFTSYRATPIFDASLFVTIRKRIGLELFEEMSNVIISEAIEIDRLSHFDMSKDMAITKDQGDDLDDSNKGSLLW